MPKDLRCEVLKSTHSIAEFHLENGDYIGASERILNAILKLTRSKFGFIGEVRHDVNNSPYLVSHALTNIAWNEEMQKIFEQRPMVFRNLDTLFGACLKTGDPVITNEPSKHPSSRGVPKGHPPLARFLGIPLKWKTKMVGMVGLANSPSDYDEHHIYSLGPLLALSASIIFQYGQDRKIHHLTNRVLSLRNNSPLMNFETARIEDDLLGKFIEVNDVLLEVLQYDTYQILYKDAKKFFTPDSISIINELTRKLSASVNEANQTAALENSVHYAARVEMIDRYQQNIPVELNLSLAIDVDNLVTGLSCSCKIFRDETGIIGTNIQSIKDWPNLINHANLGLLAIDTDGKLTEWNHTMEILTGFSFQTTFQKKYNEFVVCDENSVCHKKLEELFTGKSRRISLETTFRTRTGQLKMFLNAISIKDANENVKGVMALGQDITQINENAQSALQAQKMEAIGLMAGGLAHDLNNILAIIKGNLELIYTEISRNQELAAMVTDALSSAMDGYDITRRLTAFSRAQPLQIREVPVHSLISDFLKILRRGLKKNIRLEFNDESGDSVILIDPNQFETALLNLVLNSRDAIGNREAGRIIIKCNCVELAPGGEDCPQYLQHGNYLKLTVSDNGCGMKPSVRVQALNPYFTTKPIGMGTGFGLTMVDAFTRENGGGVSIRSVPEKGTSVILYLPLSPLSSTAVSVEILDDGEHLIPHKKIDKPTKILVVDDNEKLLRVLCKSLLDWGFIVESAENADAALRILSNEPDIELLLSDIVMHGSLSGRDLIKEVNNRFPDVLCMLMTGYEAKTESSINLTVPVLYKPFSRSQFFELLEEMKKKKIKLASDSKQGGTSIQSDHTV